MKDNSQAISKKLRTLMTKFARRLPARIKVMETHLNMLLMKDWNRKAAKELFTDLHKLSGTGTSFGFKKLSTRSRQMEEYVGLLFKEDKQLDNAQIKKLRSYFKELKKSVDNFQNSWIL